MNKKEMLAEDIKEALLYAALLIGLGIAELGSRANIKNTIDSPKSKNQYILSLKWFTGFSIVWIAISTIISYIRRGTMAAAINFAICSTIAAFFIISYYYRVSEQ